MWCQEVFTATENGKKKNSAKRCAACLTKEAEWKATRQKPQH